MSKTKQPTQQEIEWCKRMKMPLSEIPELPATLVGKLNKYRMFYFHDLLEHHMQLGDMYGIGKKSLKILAYVIRKYDMRITIQSIV